MAAKARANFESFVVENNIAMLLSMSAIIIYFIASFPIKDMRGQYCHLVCNADNSGCIFGWPAICAIFFLIP